MALKLDVSRPLRGLDGYRDLVHAIVGGHPSDESDWLEWKTDPDLSTKQGCFHVAKAILGMANRPVEVAARTCGGFGYVAIGVEPENLGGVVMPDPAVWTALVEMYLKAQSGPAWDSTIVPVDSKVVLVVAVEPPEGGDPPWPLRKEFDGYRSGTLFVRKPGRTEPALAEDVDALDRRARAGSNHLPQLVVELVGDVPIPWLAVAEAPEDVQKWVQSERDRRVEVAKALADERDREKRTPGESDHVGLPGATHFAQQQAQWLNPGSELKRLMRAGGTSGFGDEPDTRTLEEYVTELDAWAARLAGPALNDLPRRFCDAGHGLVHVRVANSSTQYLPGVEVRLHIAFEDAKGFEDVPEGDHLPKAPRPYGEAKRTWSGDLFAAPLGARFMPDIRDYGLGHLRDTYIEDGSIVLTVDVGELRPNAVYDGDEFFIFLPVRPPDGGLYASWTATVQNRDGIIDGHLTVPVQEDPVEPSDLLAGISNAGLGDVDAG